MDVESGPHLRYVDAQRTLKQASATEFCLLQQIRDQSQADAASGFRI